MYSEIKLHKMQDSNADLAALAEVIDLHDPDCNGREALGVAMCNCKKLDPLPVKLPDIGPMPMTDPPTAKQSAPATAA